MTRRWTDQQEAVFDAIAFGEANVVVEALAGSGKSTTAEECLSLVLPGERAGIVAFNKHIAQAMQKRLNGRGRATACTLHSLGYSACMSAFGRMELEEGKLARLSQEAKPDWWTDGRRGGKHPLGNRATAAMQLARLSKYTLAGQGELDVLVDHYGVEMPAGEWDAVFAHVGQLIVASEQQARTIDFDDMVWLPVRYNLEVGPFDLLLVDEAQDLSRVQQALAVRAVNGGRLCPIGDRRQCQPAGTMIRLTGGDVKPIEEIQVGDQVVSYDRPGASVVGRVMQGRRVLATACRDYDGPMITVEAAGLQTYCTPNHRWIARFTARDTDIWVTYLMRLGNWYRVGWCQLFDKHGGLHLGARTRIERAGAAWILKVHDTKTAASIHESYTAARFGLPMMPFHPVDGAQHITEESIRQVFGSLEYCMAGRAKQCLEHHGRDIEYPFYNGDHQQRQGRTTIFETQACNLIAGLMSIPVYNCSVQPLWSELSAVVSEPLFSGKVYSLQVETHETYVADGLITHNSLYGFSGADCDSLPNLQAALAATPRGCAARPLTVTFRCPRSHVALAQRLVPELEAWIGAEEGTVGTVKPEDLRIKGMLEAGDLVLCRKNAPLVALAFELIAAGVPARMRGRDIGKGLTALIDRLKPADLNDLQVLLGDYLAAEVQRLEARNAAPSAVEAVCDRVGCLARLATQARTVEALRGFIMDLFADESDAGKVILSSVHRAKGLEADVVYILEPETMPLCHARMKPWERQQESNLLYVALTRSKDQLYFAGQLPPLLR
jgi:hypothetical protein